MQYIALIHTNADASPSDGDWQRFFESANSSGMFKGGSEIGTRRLLGAKAVADTTGTVGGFMRFDSSSVEEVLTLLEQHPVILHGGSIELCEMPESSV